MLKEKGYLPYLILSASLVLFSTSSHPKPTDSSCMSNPEINAFTKDALAELQVIDSSVALTDVRNLILSLGDCITLDAANQVVDEFAASLQPTPNTAPTITGTPAASVAEGGNYSFTPNAADVDGDALSFSIINKPAWAGFDSHTGSLVGVPGYEDASFYSNIVISVSDGVDIAPLPAFSIEVTNTNRPPSIIGTAAADVVAGEPYSFIPSASDPDGDTLSFLVENLPTWMSFNSTNGTLSGIPAPEDEGTYGNINISATDGNATASLDAITITVNVPITNSPPTISGISIASIAEGERYSFTPNAADSDGDLLSFSIANQPHWTSFDSQTGTLSGMPGYDDAKSYGNIIISVTDGVDSAALPSFAIEVINTNRPPSISGMPSTKVAAGELYYFSPSAFDPDGDALTYTVTYLPAWLSFDSASGTLSGVPDTGDEGIYAGITITVSDGVEAVSLEAISITVDTVVTGSATLRWDIPTLRADGITELSLSEIAGYRIYMGSTSNDLQMVVDINDGSATSYSLTGLASGTYYFSVTTYDINDLESVFSEKVSTSI